LRRRRAPRTAPNCCVWRDEQDKAWREKLAQIDQERREEAKKEREKTNGTPPPSATAAKKDRGYPDRPKETFEPPKHPHGSKLAVYHGNRAAAYVQLQHYDRAVEDCDVALLLDASYLKALVRRATAHEHLDKNDLALSDVLAALERGPANRELRQRRDRLQKLENERLERLKAETMDKLKDLGNSILGNFGLSLDNFQATQDPNTGSYSINFQQNT
jgi:tetratricopeptide (TPR) repeat protein